MKTLFVWYPNCGTCQKAKKWLDEKQLTYEARNIKDEPPTLTELEEWYRRSGLPLKKFFNTSGLVYKSMGLKDKLSSMSEAEQLELLAGDGMLVKRPIVVCQGIVAVGFSEKEWDAVLLEGGEEGRVKP